MAKKIVTYSICVRVETDDTQSESGAGHTAIDVLDYVLDDGTFQDALAERARECGVNMTVRSVVITTVKVDKPERKRRT